MGEGQGRNILLESGRDGMRPGVLAARHPTTDSIFYFFIFFSSAEHSFIFSRTLSSKLLIDSGNTSQVKHRGMYRRSDERHLSLSGVPCAGVQSLCKCMGLQVSHPLQCRLDSMDVLVKDHIEPGSQWTEHHSSG